MITPPPPPPRSLRQTGKGNLFLRDIPGIKPEVQVLQEVGLERSKPGKTQPRRDAFRTGR